MCALQTGAGSSNSTRVQRLWHESLRNAALSAHVPAHTHTHYTSTDWHILSQIPELDYQQKKKKERKRSQTQKHQIVRIPIPQEGEGSNK